MKAEAKRALLAATLAIALVPNRAHGASITWTGAGANGNFSTTANWSTNTIPGSGDDIHFGATTGAFQPFQDIASPAYAANSISFDAGAPAYVIGSANNNQTIANLTNQNNGIVMAGTGTASTANTIINNSSNTQTLNVDIKPRAGMINAASGDLVFNNVFWTANTPNDTSGSNRTDIFSGSHNIYLNGVVTYFGGNNGTSTPSLQMNGTGTLFMTNNGNEFAGQLAINSGAVQVNQPNALGLIAGVTSNTVYYHSGNTTGPGTMTGSTDNNSAIVNVAGAASTGVLKLSDTDPNTLVATGGVTFEAKGITLGGRSTTAAGLENVHGNNTWQGPVTLAAGTGTSNYNIQADTGSTLNLATTATITGVSGTQVLNLQGAGTGIVNSIISTPAGALGVTVSGGGNWTLNGANTYTGPTTVNGSTLTVGSTGSISTSSGYSLSNNATLDLSATSGLSLSAAQTLGGTGTVKGNVSDSAGTQILPGGAGTTGTLAFNNNLTLAGGDTLQFDLSNNASGANDMITVAGNLALNGTTTLNLNLLNNVLGSGTYHLMTYGTESGAGTFNLAGGGASGSTRQTISFTNTAGQVNLIVSGQSANLTWTGSNSSTWDLKTTRNFFNTGTSAADFYYDLDSVTFDDSTNVQNVSLASVLTPAAVTVDSNKNYTFSGPGSLNGSMALTKGGTSTLTILTNNTYSGGTIINSGTVQVGNGTTSGSLGTGPVTDNGALIFDPVGTVAVPGNISGNGTVAKMGPGEVDLSGNSTYSGGTTISAGTLGAGGTTPLGTNGGGTTITAGARLLTLSTINIPGNITLAGNYDGAAGHGAIEASGGSSTAGTVATVGALTMTANTTLAADQYSALVVSGVISGAGDNVNVVGGGSVVFTGANTYTGSTTVNSGVILQPNNASSLGTGPNAAVTIANGGESYATVAETLAYPFTIAGFGVGGTAASPTTGAMRTGGATTVTYSGPINLTADAGLYADGGATMAITGNITGANTNLTLSGDTSSTGTITGNISLGTGGITDASKGNWTLAGATTSFTGPTVINTGATLTVGNGGTTGSLATTSSITNNGTLAYNLSAPYTESHNISGTGGVNQIGTGATTLSGTNTFTGPVNVNAGELIAANSSSLGTSSNVTILGNASTSILNMSGGVNLSVPITMDGRALSATNTVPVEITSDGNNTLSGSISLQTGGNAYGLQSNSGLLTVSGQFANNTGSATERMVDVGGAGNGLLSGGFALGTATGGAGIGLIKDGPGTWTLQLGNPNGLTGDVIVKQGTLAINGYGPLGRGVPGNTDQTKSIVTTITVYSGATYDLTNYSDPTGNSANPSLQVLQNLAGSGTVNVNPGQQLQAFADNTISPGIPGSPGTLTINGSLHLSTFGNSGDPAGPEPLGTTLNFGLGATPSSANDQLSLSATLDTDDICNVSIVPLGGTMSGTYTLVNAGNITGNVQNDLQINNTTRYNMSLSTSSTQVKVTISGSTGNDTWAGTQGTWDVKTTPAWTGTPNGDNLFWTADTVNFTDAGAAQPTVTISGSVAPAAVNVSSNTTNYTFSGTGAITGGASINKSGTSTLTISTANSYTGATNITNGVVIVGNASALGAAGGTAVISGTGTLDCNNFSLGSESVSISGNGFNGEGAFVNNGTGTDNAGGGTAWATQHLTLTGDASIGGSARWDLRDSAVNANDATLGGNGHNLTKVGTNEIWLVGAQISNLNSITITSGTIGLQDSTFTNTSGNTTLNDNGATVGLWSDVATTGQTITLNWNFTGTTTMTASNDPATLNGPMTVAGTTTWTSNVPFTVNSAITGAGVITTAGTNTLTLSGTNSFGGLTVGAGTTAITGNTTVGQLLGNSAATLNVSAGTLAATAQNHATATFAAVNISGGGTLDIGNGALVIPYTTTNPLTQIVGYLKAAYDKGAWDQPGLTSSATHSARGSTLGYLDTGTQVEVKYTWYGDLDFSGTVTNADLTAMNAGNGSSWAQGDLNYDGIKNADDFSLFMLGAAMQNGSIPAGVPEPGTAALLALAIPAVGLRRRRS